MNKKIGAMILALTMIFFLSMTANAAVVNKTELTAAEISAIGKVFVNDIRLSDSPEQGEFWLDANGRTQAPVRLLVEAMGYTISYNKGVVTVPGGPNGDLVITIGSNKLTVGGSTVEMDTTAVTIAGRTYVPLRYVSEALGCKVEASGFSSKEGATIKITTTFTPDRKINGVRNEVDFMRCVNMMTFHDANLDLFTNQAYSKYEPNRWVTYYEADNGGMLTDYVMTIMSLGNNGYKISGITFGTNANKQYELLKAFLKDVAENPDAIWAKIEERDKTLSKDRLSDGRITEIARVWALGEANKSYTIGNVLFTWDDNLVGFTIKTKAN